MLKIYPVDGLKGEITIGGAKNAILPIIAATILSDKEIILNSVSFLQDVEVMCCILGNIGCELEKDTEIGRLKLQTTNIKSCETKYELINKMRASILVLGPLLSRCGEAKIFMPGGCPIGSRPIDLHLKGLMEMGAQIEIEHGCIVAKAGGKISKNGTPKLKGAHIYLDFPSVGATENIMMAGVYADGETIISNAALEPEIVDLANFINSMGGKIEGAGTDSIKITGVSELSGTEYTVIPDRIEVGTFMIASSLIDSEVIINNIIAAHLKPIAAKLKEMGVNIEISGTSVRVNGRRDRKPTDIKTLPYPGFPTDLQSPFMSALSTAKGTSIVTETIFENRFKHVDELKKMGAKIKTEGRVSIIEGVKNLEGARVKATDLRAGAALIIAGLCANGVTQIEDEAHISRGYYKIEDKFRKLGVRIERC